MLVVSDEPAPNYLFVEDSAGRLVSSRTVGVVLATVPVYALVGLESFAMWPSTLMAVVLGAITVVFLFLALDRIVSRRVAVASALAFCVATPMWSVASDAIWPHSVTLAGIALAAAAAARDRWWLTGIAFGIAITGRAHVAVIAAVLGLGVAWALRSWRPAIAVGVPAVGGLAALMLINAYRYGSGPSITGGQGYAADNLTAADGSIGDYLLNWAGFLFSPDRGLLIWTPVLVVLAPAAVRAFRVSPPWVRYLAIGGIAYSAVQMRINAFGGGDAFFGYRLGLELVVTLVPLYAFGWTYVGTRIARQVAIVLLILQFAVVGTGAIVSGLWVAGWDVWTDSSIRLAALYGYPVLIPLLLLGVLTLRIASRLGSDRGSLTVDDA